MLRPEPINRTTARSAPGITTLILVTGLSTLSLNMFIPSLSKIGVTFSADYGLTSVSIAGYLGMTAILPIVIGPLSDRFGRRPVMLACSAVGLLAALAVRWLDHRDAQDQSPDSQQPH